MALRERNYWLETRDVAANRSAKPLPRYIDVAIVGGGYTGLSAALALARGGTQVAVFEAETMGWGASCRNGGMALTGLKLSVPLLTKRYGKEIVRRMYAASVESIGCVEEIVRREQIDCSFSRCGHLEVAAKPKHFDSYSRSADILKREFNHHLRIVPKNELGDEIDSKVYYGGVVDDMSAGLNPARYVAGLADAAERAGAELYEGVRITGIERKNRESHRGFELRCADGRLDADEVLIASGAYTTDAMPSLRRKIIPIGSYIIVTEPLGSESARALIPRNRMVYDSKHFLFYYRLTPDNRMLFGGRAAFFPPRRYTVRRSAEILRRGMVGIFPQLRDTQVEYVWGGTLDFTYDVMPHVGKVDDAHFALGYAGHGVAAATWFGTKVADAICGKSVDIAFDRIRFPNAPIGFRSGHPWALPLAGAYYKLLDWFT